MQAERQGTCAAALAPHKKLHEQMEVVKEGEAILAGEEPAEADTAAAGGKAGKGVQAAARQAGAGVSEHCEVGVARAGACVAAEQRLQRAELISCPALPAVPAVLATADKEDSEAAQPQQDSTGGPAGQGASDGSY